MRNCSNKLNESVNETTVDKLSKEQVVLLVKASISTLYRRNPKLITAFDKKMEDGFLSTEEQVQFLDGMYCAIIDYSKKNKTAQETIEKYGFQINESLKDYSNENKSLVWKIGYITIQYEIANRSTRRLRLYLDLFMTSKSDRYDSTAGKYKNNWALTESEKKYMGYLERIVIKTAERIEIENETGVNMQDLFLNFSKPTCSSEFYWPFKIDDNPATSKELKKIIMTTGYEDEDLDMRTNAVFTTDHSYGLSLVSNGDDCYLFLIKKTGHYWDAVLTDKKTLYVKYNFTRTFNDNIQLLLRYYEDIFPLRIKK